MSPRTQHALVGEVPQLGRDFLYAALESEHQGMLCPQVLSSGSVPHGMLCPQVLMNVHRS